MYATSTGRTAAEIIQANFTDSRQPVLHDEVEAIRSELQLAKAALTKSIFETVAAVDDLGAKHDRFEDQIDGKLLLMHSKFNKLLRTQVKQVRILT